MAKDLKNKVVVITGASSGMCRAAAIKFAKAGARVVLAARDEAALQEAARACNESGGFAIAVRTDTRNEAEVKNLARRAISEYGRIDVWVNGAAVSLFGLFEKTPSDVYRQVLETNLFGYIHGMRAAMTYFREQGMGVLINITSVTANGPQPYTSAYVSSKYAIKGLTESLRMELALDEDHDIHVCNIMPASFDTPLFQHAANYTGRKVKALEPVNKVDDVADAIVDVARNPRREVTVGRGGGSMRAMKTLSTATYEKMMAHRIDQNHLADEPAEDTEGNVFDPMQDYNEISGGWREDGKSSKKGRNAALAAVAFAVPAVVALVRRSR